MSYRYTGALHNRPTIVYDDDLFLNCDSNESPMEIIQSKPIQIEQKNSIIQNNRRKLVSPTIQSVSKRIRVSITNTLFESNTKSQTSKSRYCKYNKIGEGTYGKVFKAVNRETNQTVAIKSITFSSESTDSRSQKLATREMNLLKCFNHINIIRLLDTQRFSNNDNLFCLDLIFEFCVTDLAKIIKNRNITFQMDEIKQIMLQIFTGLDYIHRAQIMHRDMKTENILLNSNGTLKIADFGLARNKLQPHEKSMDCLTTPVVTLWYRAPELLLGSDEYDEAIDLWSAGCILAEFWKRKAMFPGKTETRQLMQIISICGSISTIDWPEVTNLNIFNATRLPRNLPRIIKNYLRTYTPNADAADLLDQLLTYNPAKRITCTNVMNHDFFWSNPFSCQLDGFMKRILKDMP